MTANLGWKVYRPDVHLPFNDQSAMGMLLEEVRDDFDDQFRADFL